MRGPSKRSTAIIFFQNCRTQCDPQHPADDIKACSGKRGTDELYCLKAIHEQEERATGAPECRVLWYFLIQKVQGITTIRKKIEKRLKVNSAIKLNLYPPRVCRLAVTFTTLRATHRCKRHLKGYLFKMCFCQSTLFATQAA